MDRKRSHFKEARARVASLALSCPAAVAMASVNPKVEEILKEKRAKKEKEAKETGTERSKLETPHTWRGTKMMLHFPLPMLHILPAIWS